MNQNDRDTILLIALLIASVIIATNVSVNLRKASIDKYRAESCFVAYKQGPDLINRVTQDYCAITIKQDDR